MNKTEWDEIHGKDARVATSVMGYKELNVTSAELILPGSGPNGRMMITYDTEGCRLFRSPYPDGAVLMFSDLPRFTTCRNACVFVLDEMRSLQAWDRFCWFLLIYLYDGTDGLPSVEYGEHGFKDLCVADAGGFMSKLLRGDPDLICFCAVKAIEDARSGVEDEK
jgi:hypothetical protein